MKTVRDVMTRVVRTADANEVVGGLRDVMLDECLHAVPVVDEKGALIGIVTSSDLVEEWAPTQGVVTAMSAPVHPATPRTTVVEATRQMLDHHIHHLPVTDGDQVVGMVSSYDLLWAFANDPVAAPTGPRRRVAHPGDHVVIPRHGFNQQDRRGLVVDARGDQGGPPWVVRWLDDPHDTPHDVIFFPGPDATIEPAASSVAK